MNRLNTIDGETPMTTPLPAIRFVVDQLLPQGLHILAGAPKVGKSWLALWLCLCVSKGESVWGFATAQSSVLYSDLLAHRKVNDEICLAHGLHVLEQPERREKKKRMTPGEYRAGLYGESWKLDLIQTINEALEYADDRESFIANMEAEGYQVRWEPNRKHITFTCPNGRKCRDSSLHDETFLKENLEMLFVYRQATGFQPCTQEPDEGWLGELAAGWFRVAAELERDEQWQLPAPPTWTDSKQRRREALKKMAMGQKFGGQTEQAQGQTM